MAKSLTEKLWLHVDELKELVNRNPNVPILDIRKAVEKIEKIVQSARRKELRKS